MFIRLGLLFSIMVLVLASEPPQLQLEAYQSQIITGLGLDVKLICPVKSRTGNLIVEWSKDGEVVQSDFHRIKIAGNMLRVKEARKDDGGRYKCTGVNGFGSESVFLDLIVLDEENSKKINLAFLPSTMSQPKYLTRNVGDYVKLPCEATGIPTPRTFWKKDGMMLLKTGMATDGITSLLFPRATVEDTGNYVCFAQNIHGSINTSYHLQILDSASSGRILKSTSVDSVHFLNTTVQQGTIATLQCRVTSDVPPHIEWLKKVEAKEKLLYANQTISVGIEEFRVLKSDDVVRKEDGSYVNRLTITNVQDEDSGLYVCLGANTMGYSFKEAYLIVTRSESGHIRDGYRESSVGFLVSIILPLSVLVFLFIGAIIWMRFHVKRTKPILPVDPPGPLIDHKYETVTHHNPNRKKCDSLLAQDNKNVIVTPIERTSDRHKHHSRNRGHCTCYKNQSVKGYTMPEYL